MSVKRRTHCVLVRIHEHPESVFFAFPEHPYGIVQKRVVVLPAVRMRESDTGSTNSSEAYARSFMLNGLPRKRESQEIEAPPPQPSEMHVRRPIFEFEWPSDKALTTGLCMLPEPVQEIRRPANWEFRRAGEIDTTEQQRATCVVDKLAVGGVHKRGRRWIARRWRHRRYWGHVVMVEEKREVRWIHIVRLGLFCYYFGTYPKIIRLFTLTVTVPQRPPF